MRFLLVDKILKLEPGKHILATKTMDSNEELFRDHFPGFPVVPGVLLTEMIAQAAGKCLDAEKRDRGKAMLARIKSANFHNWVLPGEEIQISVTIQSSQPKYATVEGIITVDDKKVCTAELFFGFLSLDHFAPDYKDEVLDKYLAKEG